MVYTLLIKNGTVVDGTGNQPYLADIGIVGDRIKDVGKLDGKADLIIDATNLYVTPGFIDITCHSDTTGTLFAAPFQDSLLMQGVTTILVGNCGYSLAPLANPDALNDLQRWANTSEFNANWNTVGEYLKTLETVGPGINIATLVGHELLKKNTANLDEMALLLSRGMQDGAWGLSSNLSFVEWTPALKDEIRALARVVKQYGGMLKVHMADEGKNMLPAIAAVLSIARESGARTVISHLKAIGRSAWNEFFHALGMIERARKEGADVAYDLFPYLRTGSMLLSLLPPWAREGDNNAILARITQFETRSNILKDLATMTLHADRFMIASAAVDKSIVGKTLQEISQNVSLTPEEVILEILDINRLGVAIFGRTLHSKNLLAAAAQDAAAIASDGAGYDLSFEKSKDLVHPRSFGAFPRFFSHIAPEAKLPVEKTIAKMTSLPAHLLGLPRRGTIATGNIADIAIFHPEEFKDTATYKNPYRFAEGMRHVIIGGETAISQGVIKKERNGAVLRRA